MVQFKGALVLGALIGTGIGILLAPEKGSDTRAKLKKEGLDIKDKFVEDFTEVKDDLSKAAISGKEKISEDLGDLKVKASLKADQLITFLEEQLATLKEKNKSLHHTS